MSDELIIHTPCGLPVELCTCPNARVVYDWEKDAFVDRRDPNRGNDSPGAPEGKEGGERG